MSLSNYEKIYKMKINSDLQKRLGAGRVYLSGRVTGNDNALIEFQQIEDLLRNNGVLFVTNPTKLVESDNWEYAMKICIKELLECKYIVLLPDYDFSKGALLEKHIAESLGMGVWYITKNTQYSLMNNKNTFALYNE